MITNVKYKMAAGCEDLKPQRAHDDDAAFDIRAQEDVSIRLGEVKCVKVGFQMEMDPGWEAQVRPRSGLALKHGIAVVNSPGTVDAGYRGDVGVILKNSGTEAMSVILDNCSKISSGTHKFLKDVPSYLDQFTFNIKRGDRIAQLVISQIPAVNVSFVDELSDSSRGAGGFGSTGKK